MSMMHRSSRLPPQCSSSKKTQQQKDQPSSSKNVWSSIARTESTKSFSTDSSLLSYGSSSFASSPSLASSSFLFGNGRSSCGDIKSHLSTQSTYCSIIAPKDSHNISQAAVVTSSSSVISPASSSSLLLSSSSTNNNTIGSSVGGGNKIKPYRFRDEPQKKNIVKTELCSAILEGRPCKFGAKCNFAHHEGELRYQTIRERHNAGLIDGEIWRTRPCLNHIATGDCPFSLRCACVHDPRISGSIKWWLPHCALKSTHLETDIHVDRHGKYHFSQMHYGQPFGKALAAPPQNVINESSSNAWKEFYNNITNKDRNSATNLNCSEYHRVQIAKSMRNSYESMSNYNYQPSHKILNEICMLIQTKVFNVKNDTVVEITPDQYDSMNPFHVIVREIAFGPLCSPSDRPLALWFNIPEADVEECTAKEILRLKRTERKLAEKKKQLQLSLVNNKSRLHPRITNSTKLLVSSSSGGKDNMTYAQIMCSKKSNISSTVKPLTRSTFDDESSLLDSEFLIYCPQDEAAYDLITDILHHRVDALDPAKDTEEVAKRYALLEQKYTSLMRHFSLFHWPVNKGRSNVDRNTPIPKIDTRYEVPVEEHKDDENNKKLFHDVWESFADTAASGFRQSATSANIGKRLSSKKRLDVFVNLSQKTDESCTGPTMLPGNMPLIKKHKVPPGFSKNVTIFSKEEDKDWETVQTHYLSKKTQVLGGTVDFCSRNRGLKV